MTCSWIRNFPSYSYLQFGFFTSLFNVLLNFLITIIKDTENKSIGQNLKIKY